MDSRTLMYRDWMFTSFDEELHLPEDEVEYSIYQREKCPTSGKLHWQGFVRFVNRKRFTQVKKLLGKETHIEYARSVEKSIEYCSKNDTRVDTPIEIGVRPKKMSKLNVVDMLKSRTCLEIVKDQPNLWRSYRQLQALQADLTSPRKSMTTGIFLSGETGKGKSRICGLIAEYVGQEDVYWATSDAQWFDGYNGQKMVIIDEVREMKPGVILRLVDRYPTRMPVKGGFCQWKPTWIFLTSNLAIDSVVPCDLKTHCAILRRVKTYEVY